MDWPYCLQACRQDDGIIPRSVSLPRFSCAADCIAFTNPSFLPVDGAFYLYADISGFSSDSFEFATRMLEEAGVAATPGVDFDPFHGRKFLRLCYAGSRDDMREAVERIGNWLTK